MRKRFAILVFAGLLTACGASGYQATPTEAYKSDKDIQCVNVQHWYKGWTTKYYAVGLFCRVPAPTAKPR